MNDYLRDPSPSIQLRNITFSARTCYAAFHNGHSVGQSTVTGDFVIPDQGIILNTGHPFDFRGNDDGETTAPYGQETGEPDLESQLVDGDEVFDPCYIQFDFRCHPSTPRVVLDYVFGSEEYPVRVSSIMNWCIQSGKESTRRRVVDNARK